MKALLQTQGEFQRYVLHGEGGIAAEIAGPDEEFRKIRLDVYYDAYRLRLVEVLGSDFETLKAFAGEETFDSIARAYLDTHPSTFRNVRWFGAGLPGFLRQDARYREYPVLAELAQFEWTLGLAFDAPDVPVLTFDALTRLPADAWGAIGFSLHPSVHSLELRWNIAAIWNAIDRKQIPPEPVAEDQPVTIAIWRKEFSSHFRSLPGDEAQMLSAARGGANFPQMCEQLALGHGEDAAAVRAAELLRGWVDQGWLSDYTLTR